MPRQRRAHPLQLSEAFQLLDAATRGVVKIYNAMSSLVRFENNIFVFYEKRSSLLQRRRCSCKFNSRRIGS
jgi:hypothetical protein